MLTSLANSEGMAEAEAMGIPKLVILGELILGKFSQPFPTTPGLQKHKILGEPRDIFNLWRKLPTRLSDTYAFAMTYAYTRYKPGANCLHDTRNVKNSFECEIFFR